MDWIKWTGWECPVDPNDVVEYSLGDGVLRSARAGELDWSNRGLGGIAAYRVVIASDAKPCHNRHCECEPGKCTVPGFQDARHGAAPAPTPPSAPALLDKAAGHMRDRAATYDQPDGERSMGRAVAALNAVLGRQALTESEGWLLLQLLKDVRDRQRAAPHTDSLEDCIAYAALKAEARLQEVQP